MGLNIDAFKQDAQQTIQRINGNVGSIYGDSSLNSSIYTSTYLESSGMQMGTGGSIFSSAQNTYNQYSYSTGSVDSDMVKALGANIRNLAANNDRLLANILANARNQAAQAQNPQGQTQSVNLNNSAEGFSKLTSEQKTDLANKEKEIKAAEEEKAKETDAETKNEKQKAIDKLKSEYRALEKEYGVEGMSELFGSEFNFYGNLDDKELGQIKEANGEIESMRSQLESKKTRMNEKWGDIQKKMNEYAAKNGGILPKADDIMSRAEKAYFDNSKKDIEKLEKEITEKIDNLNENIKSSAKDEKTTFFATANAERAEKTKKEENKQSVADAAGAMWKKNGDKEEFDEKEFNKKFAEIKGDDIKNADNNAVKKFIAAQAKNAGSEDAFKTALDEDFFKALKDNNIITGEKEKANGNIRLLQKFYDSIKGDGAFEKKVKDLDQDNYAAIKNLWKDAKPRQETT